jgi:restriction endonuclease S subunit
MSYNINNYQNIFNVSFKELEGRFDPAFYKPEYSNILKKTVTWVMMKNISFSIQHPPEYERKYSETGLQLIRSQNVRPTGLNLEESPVYFSLEFLKNKKVIFPQSGDILVVRSGVNAGDVTVIEKDIDNAIIGADNLLIKPDLTKVTPKFVQIFFYTKVGRKILNRYLTGATNKHISPYYMAKVNFPLVEMGTQFNCIDIFENGLIQKNKKETQAKQLLASIDGYLLNELGITLPEKDNSLENRIFTTSLSKVSGGRFDPLNVIKFEYLQKQQSRYEKVKFKELLLSNPQYGANLEAIDGDRSKDIRYIRITDIDEYGNLRNSEWKTAKTINSIYKLNKDDILIARTGATVGKSYIHKDESLDAIFAGYLIRFIVDKTKVLPEYVFYYLNTSIYSFWISAIQRPSAQPNINSKEYKSLIIPIPPIDKQNEIADHISHLRAKVRQLQHEALEELEKAKLEVEKIILNN